LGAPSLTIFKDGAFDLGLIHFISDD
jgi:hypothetical protein